MQHEKPLEVTLQIVSDFFSKIGSKTYEEYVDIFYKRWYEIYFPYITQVDFEDTFFDYICTDKDISAWTSSIKGSIEWKKLVIISFFFHAIHKKYYESNESNNKHSDGIKPENHPNGFDLLF